MVTSIFSSPCFSTRALILPKPRTRPVLLAPVRTTVCSPDHMTYFHLKEFYLILHFTCYPYRRCGFGLYNGKLLHTPLKIWKSLYIILSEPVGVKMAAPQHTSWFITVANILMTKISPLVSRRKHLHLLDACVLVGGCWQDAEGTAILNEQS